MKVNGKSYRTIWMEESNQEIIKIIDQRWLPHQFIIEVWQRWKLHRIPPLILSSVPLLNN